MHNHSKENPVSIGTPPCTRVELISNLVEFLKLYQQRPIKDNDGGMKAPQMFSAWFMAKKLQPSSIIESGVWFGQGTWFFEKACPEAKLFCIDPRLDLLQYRSDKASYTSYDFSLHDWKSLVDCESTLCFFDDHQDAPSRLEKCASQGFKHLMFEDNYPRGQGDCVSLKTILEKNEQDADTVMKYLSCYYEFPPPVKGELTRWGDKWNNENYPTYDPLLVEGDPLYEDYLDGYENYTWICYAELGNND